MQETIEHPYKDSEDRWNELTVGDLIKMLGKIPSSYAVKYDTFCGSISKGDLAIDHEEKQISING